MKKTLCRAFALLLTASFLFAMASPAFATSVAEDTFLTYAMPADIVTSSLINGIGVLPGDDVQVYEGVVQRCVDYLTDLGRVVDGKIDVWKREQVGENAWKYGADISLVEVIRDWLFETGNVRNYNDNWNTQFSADGFTFKASFPFDMYSFYYGPSGYSKSYYWVCVSNNSGWLTVTWPDGKSAQYNINDHITGTSIYYDLAGTSDTALTYNFQGDLTSDYANASICASAIARKNGQGVSVALGLNSGFIAPGSVVFGDAYPDWYRNIATIPLPGVTSPDDDIKALPFAPGQTLGDTLTIPQEDVWTGSGSYVEAPAVPDTVTLSDVLTAVLSIPANIVAGIGNLFFPAVDGLTMSLSDFFPFCIPYDLFEFFTLLRAEPEAPKFEWEIPVPQLGRTFEVEVDLSAWDEVAQLFRNLELLAFIVGLAFVTREKFLRS